MDEKIMEIEERYKNLNYIPDLMTTDEVESDVKILLSHIKKLQQDIDREITYKEALEQAEVKIEELEEGIEKHHNKKLEIKKFFANISENHPQAQQIPDGADEELYGLLKEKRK